MKLQGSVAAHKEGFCLLTVSLLAAVLLWPASGAMAVRPRNRPRGGGPLDRRTKPRTRAAKMAKKKAKKAAAKARAARRIAKIKKLKRSLESAEKLFRWGAYKEAFAMYRALARGRTRPAAYIGMGRVLIRTGRYKKALGVLKRAQRMRKVAGQAAALLGRLHFLTGDYKKAQAVLEAAIKKQRFNLEARITLARVFQTTGQRVAARARFKDFFTDLRNGYLKESNPAHLLYLGMAARGMESWQEASSTFEEAAKKAPKMARIWLEWAALALKKYRVDWADEYYKKVLALDPNHPAALAGLAWVEWYAPRSDHHKGRQMAKKALSVNPKCISATLYLTSLEIFDAKYRKATKLVDAALKVNSNHSRALALKATVYFLTEQHKAFARIKQKALQINSRDAGFFNLAAKFVSRHHRYADAAALNKQALQVDPKSADALADLGINQLRTGAYGMGWFNLKEAYRLDQFNHKTANLLTLREGLQKRYKWVRKGYLRFLFPKDEINLLARYVPQVLNRTIALYLKKYGYKPHIPVYMELYDKARDFQARTFGEPAETGIMGVCFGKVVTSMSPSLGRTNWAYVLWHELAHVIHTQLTKGKVPRWFTEGLAEYETVVARPEWKREHSRNLYRMKATGTMPAVVDLDVRFTRSKTMMGVIMAYYQSTLIVEFIHKKLGWPKIVAALHAYAKGHDTARVIRGVFGMSPAAFDKRFSAYLDTRLAHYKDQFDPLDFIVSIHEDFVKKTKAALEPEASTPKSRRIKLGAQLAMFYALRGKKQKSTKALARARKLDAQSPYVRFAQALLHRANHNSQAATTLLEKLIKEGHDSYDGRMQLAKLATKQKAYKKAIGHLEAARKLDPEAAKPLIELAFIYKKLNKDKKIADVVYDLAWIKQTSASIVYTAIRRNAMLKKWDRVRKLGTLGIHNQPFNAYIHEKYAWALRAAGKHKKALFEFQSALMCKPKNKQYIHVGMARSYLGLGQKKKALVHVNRALDVDANFPPAVHLLRKLRGN
jgi:tetratricopeptide (TPR) repeat protein